MGHSPRVNHVRRGTAVYCTTIRAAAQKPNEQDDGPVKGEMTS